MVKFVSTRWPVSESLVRALLGLSCSCRTVCSASFEIPYFSSSRGARARGGGVRKEYRLTTLRYSKEIIKSTEYMEEEEEHGKALQAKI